jgi:broad specificity phosphatase PhoE
VIKEYGRPREIIVSPYIRTRQKAQLVNSELNVPIYINVNFAERVTTNVQSEHIDRSDTLQYGSLPLNETNFEFINRIKRFRTESDIWYVSHSLVIKGIAWMKGKVNSRSNRRSMLSFKYVFIETYLTS